jgi:hypothetical protein
MIKNASNMSASVHASDGHANGEEDFEIRCGLRFKIGSRSRQATDQDWRAPLWSVCRRKLGDRASAALTGWKQSLLFGSGQSSALRVLFRVRWFVLLRIQQAPPS